MYCRFFLSQEETTFSNRTAASATPDFQLATVHGFQALQDLTATRLVLAELESVADSLLGERLRHTPSGFNLHDYI